MCGIVAFIGKHSNALPFIISSLKRLEYRGYDSAGVVLQTKVDLVRFRSLGNVEALEKVVKEKNVEADSFCGIGHTRWATHGEPSVKNAHPHFSPSGEIAVVHNGMIENYRSLKKLLENQGYTFKSETDTEILAVLIEEFQKNLPSLELNEVVKLALAEVVGAYAIAVISKKIPGMIIAAKKGSPLIIGFPNDNSEFAVVSSQEPLIGFAENMINLNDGEIAVLLSGEKLLIKNHNNEIVEPYIEKITMSLEEIEKGGYTHFMEKEIHEQPQSLENTMRGRLKMNSSTSLITLGGIQNHMNDLKDAKRIILLGCGTSLHSAMVGKYLFESLARIPVNVETASEFRYRNPVLNPDDIIIGLSQSGQTADTNGALISAKPFVKTVLGICNVVGSEMSRLTDAGCYTHAGVEIGVASTKAFTSQVALLSMMALSVGYKKKALSWLEYKSHVTQLSILPELVKSMLEKSDEIKQIALLYKESKNFMYMGRGYGYPLALEGALKLKEISYIHAEGLCAAEIKHGVIALIDENMPTVIIATKESDTYMKVVNSMEQIKARKGKIIAICTEGDELVPTIADHCITIPSVSDFVIPIVASIPLQLLAYHMAVLLGHSVDQPRGLAKAVTVE